MASFCEPTVLFLSPHFDDVAFSCGGSLCAHREQGARTLVVTLFAALPPADLRLRPLHRELLGSDLVSQQSLHSLWQTRIDEDHAAMQLLGTEYLHLPFLDAAFRPEVSRWAELWQPPAIDCEGPGLPAELLRSLRLACGEQLPHLIYAPLAVGAHRDHILAFELGVMLLALGASVRFYEDVPYIANDSLLQRRLAALHGQGLQPQLLDVTPHHERRVAAAMCYRSQLPAGGREDGIRQLLQALGQARQPGPGRLGERFWVCRSREAANPA